MSFLTSFSIIKREIKLLRKNNIFSDWQLVENYLQHNVIGARVRLEASSVCQLSCPLCSLGRRGDQDKNDLVGYGFLRFSDFKRFVNSNPWIRNIELSNNGEIFLNPELMNIIKYAYGRKIILTAANGVNLNSASDKMPETLVKYKFVSLRVSLDGASKDIYSKYRIGGDFDRVIKNIEKLNYYKLKYNSNLPRLKWQFIVFEHNKHEIRKARDLAKKLQMEFELKRNLCNSFSSISKLEEKKIEDSGGFHAPSLTCLNLWEDPQINWDGKMLGCCVNYWSDFGNVFQEGFDNVIRSERYEYAKAMILGLKPPRQDIPCKICSRYKNKLLQKYMENKRL
jgi:sulfatase maturation enzyme AslB (radical SAM superfamily)